MRPRRDQVDHTVVSTCHCTSRCVRRASLLAGTRDGLLARTPWIAARLKHLVAIFAIELDTFSIMDNHLHLVLTIRPDIVASWSDEEVAKRWLRYLPPKTRGVQREVTVEDIQTLVRDSAKVASCRLRLCQLGEFHKAVEEPLARLARTPEQSAFTGVQHRVSARNDALRGLSRRERSRLMIQAKRLAGWRHGCITFPQEPVPAFLTPIADTPERRGLFQDLTLDEYLVVVSTLDLDQPAPGQTGVRAHATGSTSVGSASGCMPHDAPAEPRPNMTGRGSSEH